MPHCRPATAVPVGEKKGVDNAEESEGLLDAGNGDVVKGNNSPPNGFRSNSSNDLKAKEFV